MQLFTFLLILGLIVWNLWIEWRLKVVKKALFPVFNVKGIPGKPNESKTAQFIEPITQKEKEDYLNKIKTLGDFLDGKGDDILKG